MAEQESERGEHVAQDAEGLGDVVRDVAAAVSDGKHSAEEQAAAGMSRMEGQREAGHTAGRLGMVSEGARQGLGPVMAWTRQQPAMALGVAFVAGLVCGRSWGRRRRRRGRGG